MITDPPASPLIESPSPDQPDSSRIIDLYLNQSGSSQASSPPDRQGSMLIILFDGVCNLCNSSVQFILRHDKTGRFRFASLQGPAGQEILRQFGLPPDDLHSFVLVENDRFYTRSSAALRVLRHLGGAWKGLYILHFVPVFFRDGIYNLIARNRYRWFGKRESCWLPTPELKKRFLD